MKSGSDFGDIFSTEDPESDDTFEGMHFILCLCEEPKAKANELVIQCVQELANFFHIRC